MHLQFLALLHLLALSGAVSVGQIPVVDGVIGGVPTEDTASFGSLVQEPLFSNVTTPGKLRVVEKSGVCGAFTLPASLIFDSFVSQRPLRAFTKHLVTET